MALESHHICWKGDTDHTKHPSIRESAEYDTEFPGTSLDKSRVSIGQQEKREERVSRGNAGD